MKEFECDYLEELREDNVFCGEIRSAIFVVLKGSKGEMVFLFLGKFNLRGINISNFISEEVSWGYFFLGVRY